MGILSVIGSLRKSAKLTQLQRKIRPEIKRLEDFMKCDEGALKEYLSFCSQDKNVREIMLKYNLTTGDLVETLNNLEASGVAQWVKGHHVALSAIAYAEPLEFYMWSKAMHNVSDIKRAYYLVTYFSKPPGSLYSLMAEPNFKG